MFKKKTKKRGQNRTKFILLEIEPGIHLQTRSTNIYNCFHIACKICLRSSTLTDSPKLRCKVLFYCNNKSVLVLFVEIHTIWYHLFQENLIHVVNKCYLYCSYVSKPMIQPSLKQEQNKVIISRSTAIQTILDFSH